MKHGKKKSGSPPHLLKWVGEPDLERRRGGKEWARKEGTLFLTTASESSSNSRTSRLKVKLACNLGKERIKCFEGGLC